MKIVFTGGGTGGHFYPIIAVAEQLNTILKERAVSAELIYMAPEPYNNDILEKTGLTYKHVPAGKRRRYFSLKNPIDLIKTIAGVIVAFFKLLMIYPDAVFAKGAYGSFPVLVAARILFIPVMIHESDSVPGRVNKWAGKFAKRVALSYADTAEYFPEDRVAHTGQPLRDGLSAPAGDTGRNYFEIPHEIPTILVLGGSQGAQLINTTVSRALPRLLDAYYVIHQAGEHKFEEVTALANAMLEDASLKHHYKLYGHMDQETLRHAAAAADIVITRAGSTLFEVALWGIPSIVIPISSSNGDHQRKNAYAHAGAGAAVVIEENNLSANLLVSEIKRIIENEELQTRMREATEHFRDPEASHRIAEGLYELARTHT